MVEKQFIKSTPQSVNKALLDAVIVISQQAGAEIMKVYSANGAIEVESKLDDSPLTKADMASHHHICDALLQISDYPILSEEAANMSAEERLSWQSYWLIDPLDGTKEFIERNDEFTVNVALIHQHQPVLGVVYVPVSGECYYALKGKGAYKSLNGTTEQIFTRSLESSINDQRKVKVMGSRRNGLAELDVLAEKISKNMAEVELVNKGSSLKFCLLAEGLADFYPRLAPTSEWDTAAAQLILEEAGGCVLTTNMQSLRYNTKVELLNPFFYAIADNSERWHSVLMKSV